VEQRSGAIEGLPRVLVLDDDQDTLMFMGRLLSQIPVDAVPAATCADARRALEVMGGLDIIIADWKLQDGDGCDLLIEAKRRHGCGTVMMSGSPPPNGAAPDGIDLWLMKPICLAQLKEAVTQLSSSK
jgi:DNA-binding response OmpR family regulator